jgi:hypothetical protein
MDSPDTIATETGGDDFDFEPVCWLWATEASGGARAFNQHPSPRTQHPF